ncbi:MAG: hypothetical protein U1F49_05645 [Rubrivivax sp.]
MAELRGGATARSTASTTSPTCPASSARPTTTATRSSSASSAPQEQTRRLFEIFCAALGHTSWFARVRHGLVAALRQYRSNVAERAPSWRCSVPRLLAHLLLRPARRWAGMAALLSWSLALVLSVIVAVTLTLAA